MASLQFTEVSYGERVGEGWRECNCCDNDNDSNGGGYIRRNRFRVRECWVLTTTTGNATHHSDAAVAADAAGRDAADRGVVAHGDRGEPGAGPRGGGSSRGRRGGRGPAGAAGGRGPGGGEELPPEVGPGGGGGGVRPPPVPAARRGGQSPLRGEGAGGVHGGGASAVQRPELGFDKKGGNV